VSALSVAAARVIQLSLREMLSTWVPTVLGLIPSVRAVSLLLAPRLIWRKTSSSCGDVVAQQIGKATRAIDNQPGDVVLVGHSWGGVAWRSPRRGTTHATAFSNDLEWASILTVMQPFASIVFSGIVFIVVICSIERHGQPGMGVVGRKLPAVCHGNLLADR